MPDTIKAAVLVSLLITVNICDGQDGRAQGEALKNKVDNVLDAYKKPTSADGIHLQATVDGKKWAADWMYVDPSPSKSFNVNAHKGDVAVISFDIGKSVVKKKGSKNFSELSGVQMVDDNHNMFFGNEGAYQITNVTDTSIEGNFRATVKDAKSGTTHQITDGSFRVTLPEKWKAD